MNNLKKFVSILVVASTIPVTVNAEVNKYNEMDYVNNSNRTIGEIAEEKQMSAEDFIAIYNLPNDMPANTNEAAAFYNMTLENVANMYGISTEELIKQIESSTNSDKELNKDSLWSDAQGMVTIKNHIGELSFDEFKKAYNLDDAVTEDTMLGEIRNTVARKQLEFSGELTYFTSNDLLVMAEGKYLDFDVAPAIINDRTMVPMRNIFEYFKAEIAWDGETRTIIAKSGDDIITMQVGQNFFFLNDTKVELDSPSVIVNDRTLVPLRAISEALKREVSYNANTRTAIIH